MGVTEIGCETKREEYQEELDEMVKRVHELEAENENLRNEIQSIKDRIAHANADVFNRPTNRPLGVK